MDETVVDNNEKSSNFEMHVIVILFTKVVVHTGDHFLYYLYFFRSILLRLGISRTGELIMGLLFTMGERVYYGIFIMGKIFIRGRPYIT